MKELMFTTRRIERAGKSNSRGAPLRRALWLLLGREALLPAIARRPAHTHLGSFVARPACRLMWYTLQQRALFASLGAVAGAALYSETKARAV